jgi:hypothetical protein
VCVCVCVCVCLISCMHGAYRYAVYCVLDARVDETWMCALSRERLGEVSVWMSYCVDDLGCVSAWVSE